MQVLLQAIMSANLQPKDITQFDDVSTSPGAASTPSQLLGREGAESGSGEHNLFDDDLCRQLYHESHAAKIWRVAQKFLIQHVSCVLALWRGRFSSTRGWVTCTFTLSKNGQSPSSIEERTAFPDVLTRQQPY